MESIDRALQHLQKLTEDSSGTESAEIEKTMDAVRALRTKAERLDLALTVANDGMYDWDVQSNEIYFDDRYYTMAGYEPYDFPGTF